ncbi:hypothetical protein [Pseudodesulfovibrio portus]|uniref:Phage ABA sandwich domain-containing protein n=1 Tax=Pseudodesulfovibrio portus TaxID=231439 RepID=A0ABM8AVQ0_9BACT|nr:hypothetical protein [Pseudodesulfovibrio portus]BDQ35529.1 hypothetical protein JCM14722_30710 [Pseudodesulfovibrio portus]
MQQLPTEEIDRRIERFLDCDLPDRPTADIGCALRVADFMESKGFGFQLTDMCPNSPDQTLWKAVFITADAEFAAEDVRGAVAICAAAAAALEAAEVA